MRLKGRVKASWESNPQSKARSTSRRLESLSKRLALLTSLLPRTYSMTARRVWARNICEK